MKLTHPLERACEDDLGNDDDDGNEKKLKFHNSGTTFSSGYYPCSP